MKILDGMPVSGQSPIGPKAPDKNSQAGPTFSEILKQTVGPTPDSAGRTQVAATAPATPANPSAMHPQPAPTEGTRIDRIERFIDVIDTYRCKIGDPQCSLKQIQPLVEQMTAEKEKMQGMLEELPDQEPLRDVLNRALVTVSTELWKFNRGDYV